MLLLVLTQLMETKTKTFAVVAIQLAQSAQQQKTDLAQNALTDLSLKMINVWQDALLINT